MAESFKRGLDFDLDEDLEFGRQRVIDFRLGETAALDTLKEKIKEEYSIK